MKQLTVISGKGGTGKTSLTAAFAHLRQDAVMADCDVDAANLHLIVSPIAEPVSCEPFMSGYLAVIDASKCAPCGKCVRACRFGAVVQDASGPVEIKPLLCEGCGACVDACGHEAIRLVERKAGELRVLHTRFGTLVDGALGIAQSASGKLVTQVRNRAVEIATREGRPLVLVDGPPGIGCPVIASLTGVDAALVVTEPTVSGLHDLERVLNLCRHFHVRAFVTINKFDLNREVSDRLACAAAQLGAEVSGRIRFDPLFSKAVVAQNTILEYNPAGPACGDVTEVWDRLQSAILDD